jgi:hypothetical protein
MRLSRRVFLRSGPGGASGWLAAPADDLPASLEIANPDRGRRLINAQDPRVVRREVSRQLDAFVRMTGTPPTYNREREVEPRSLCDAQVRAAIAEGGIRLISFREYARIAARPRPSCRGAS